MGEWCSNGDRRLGVYEDSITLRPYCTICAADAITSSRNAHLQYLSDLIPYVPGERVECWTTGTDYEGAGVVIEVSTDLKNGGTPARPACLVKLDRQPDEPLWFTPICLKRTRSEGIHG